MPEVHQAFGRQVTEQNGSRQSLSLELPRAGPLQIPVWNAGTVSTTAPLSLAQPCSVHLSLFKQKPCIPYSHTPCLDLLAITDSYAEQVSGHVRDRVNRKMGSRMNVQINE